MKYKIIKCISKTLNVIEKKGERDINEVITSVWYEAKRKGRIFGFWHKIGHEVYAWDGELIAHTTKTVEEMEDYIRKYHEVEYSNDPIEIIKEINI